MIRCLIKKYLRGNCMNKFVAVIMLLLLSGCFSSCSLLKHKGGKGKKKDSDTTHVQADTARVAVAPAPAAAPKPDTAVKPPVEDQKQLINRITPYWTSRLTYNTFSGKARIHVETPDEGNDFAAHFRVRKDSVIWVSVNLAGIPVARVFVTRDSIFLIDYYHKEAKCLPLSQIAKILPAAVNFASLQNLVLGEPLTDGLITEANHAGDSLMIKVSDTSYLQNITYNYRDSNMRNELLTTMKPGGPVVTAEYSGYELINGRKLSTNRVIHVQNNNALYLLEMNFTKIDFDEQLDYPFSIPNKYR